MDSINGNFGVPNGNEMAQRSHFLSLRSKIKNLPEQGERTLREQEIENGHLVAPNEVDKISLGTGLARVDKK